MIRCVILVGGAEVAEGIEETKDGAYRDAFESMSIMEKEMANAIGLETEYYAE